MTWDGGGLNIAFGAEVTSVDTDQAKHAIRERVWALLERERAVPPGVHGRIPAFFGAEAAADRLAELPVWQSARVVKAVPDKAQLPVRARALTLPPGEAASSKPN